MGKKVITATACLVGLTTFALYLLSSLVDESKILELLSASVEKQTESKLIVGQNSTISFFPNFALNLIDVSLLSNNPKNSAITADQIKIGVTLSSLLDGTLAVTSLKIVGIEATINKHPDTNSKISGAGNNLEAETPHASRQNPSNNVFQKSLDSLPLDFSLASLEIQDAKITLLDDKANTSQQVKIIAIDLENFNTTAESISLNGRIAISGKSTATVTIEAKAKINLRDGILELSDMNLALDGYTPEKLIISGKGEIDITKKVSNFKITGLTDKIVAEVALKSATEESPEIDLKIALNQLDDSLLKLFNDESKEPVPDTEDKFSKKSPPKNQTFLDQPLPLDELRKLDIKAELDIARAYLGPNLITDIDMILRINRGEMTLSKVNGKFNSGLLSLKSQINMQNAATKFGLKAIAQEIDLNSIATNYGARNLITGLGNATIDISGYGTTPREIIHNLTGPVKVETTAVTLQKINLEKIMCHGIALINKKAITHSFPFQTEFASLKADLNFSGGKLEIKSFLGKLASLQLDGNGLLNLENNDLTLELEGKLFESFGEVDPACVLDNRYANLTWPISCKGNIEKPSNKLCKINAESVLSQLAKQTVKDKAKTLFNKLFRN